MFEKYDAYKDSGVDSLGKIPNDWEILRFRDICDFGKGLNITKENLEEAGIPCVNYGEVHSKYGFEVNPEIHQLKCVSENYLKSSPKSLLRYGDFVFADTSEDIEGSGNFTYLNSYQITLAGYHTVIVRPKNNINVRFLAYVFDSLSFRNQIRKAVKGVKVYSITKSILKDTAIWLPDLEDQYEISQFLDKKTSEIDQAIAIKEQQIALLNERKQVVIQKAVTQGLDPNVPMKDSGVEWIGEIPEHWEIIRSKFLFTQRKENSRKDDVQLSATQAYGVIPQEEYEKRTGKSVVKISLHLDKRKRVHLNDFVISMRSFQGGLERAWAEGCIRSSYVVLKPLKPIDPDYYGYLFKTPMYIKALQNTSNFIRDGQDLNFGNFSQVDLFIVPLSEQKQIVEYIKSQLGDFEKHLELLNQQIEKLKEYKTTLINDAVTGKIKVA